MDGRARLLRLVFDGPSDSWHVQQVVEPPALDRIMGLARDDEGNRYVASGVIEEGITLEYPAPGEYRSGIVRLVKLDPSGEVLWDVDLDPAREATGTAPELLINPMVAATSRLVWGDGRLALLHGINTDPDGQGVRHQKALTTHLDAATGEVTRTASIWVSHSFDQRMIYDGQGFFELHLGDAYPRDLVFARVEPDSGPYPALHVKGTTGDNNTFSRLGEIALVDEALDPAFGYLLLFSTESTAALGAAINGPRNLGLVRIRRAFDTADPGSGAHLDPDLPDTLTVTVDGVERTNRLRWLTDYDVASGHHAERPKLVSVGCGAYVVLWEQWDGAAEAYLGTWAMAIDHAGEVLVPPRLVTDRHLPRGDDAFAYDDTAAWLTGDAETRSLTLHRVTAELNYTQTIIH